MMPKVPKSFEAEFIRSQGANSFYEASDLDAIIKIRMTREISSQEFFEQNNNEISLIMSLYRLVDSPYPGPISNQIACDETLTPKKNMDAVTYYSLYATNWFSYGACAWDQIAFRSIIYYYYCDAERAGYKIEIFFPKEQKIESYIKLLQKATC